MIEIDDKIVSADLLRECFACDLAQCKGICCVEGNAGAPLEAEEVDILKREYEAYRPYMTPEGIEAVERQGFMVVDEDGDLTTPLVGDAECAYTYSENGITFCADSVGGMFGLYFLPSVPHGFADVMKSDTETFNRFFHGMLERGVYFAPSVFEAGFVSIMHTDEVIDATIAAARETFAEIAA